MLRGAVKEIEQWLQDIRRDFHMYPELRFQEKRTAAKVAEYLEGFGLEVKTGVGGTGVVGLYRGNQPEGRTFALRADMDALPIQEENELPFSSRHPGVMHACGHDAHMAMVLGVARLLSESAELRERLKGKVKLIFQPGEEGGHGARQMISAGAMENPRVDVIVAAHVAPLLPVGTVGIYLREACASADSFEVRIVGKGAHAAYPHLSLDPVPAGAQIISGLQTLVSRNTDPGEGLVLSVTQVRAGTATNVIPDEMYLAGTIRALSPEIRQWALQRLEQVVQGVCQAHSLGAEISWGDGYPPMTNHQEVSSFIARVAAEMVGQERVRYRRPKFGSEDFGYFLSCAPGAGFDLGCANEEKGIRQMLHTCRFDLDEDVLGLGVELYLRLLEKYFADPSAACSA
ncbi:MAG: amidohydrolase [Deltaproteobacteria bacterium]|nr:amidohydrolase [Deltaproteobacteria bacterium]MBW2070238.1 amidohydrolase [Deltaproteobacteria bacterium]